MTDSDKIYEAIDGLRRELRDEFSQRRQHVDREFRRVHMRINEVEGKIEPLTVWTGSQRTLAKVGAWVIGTLIGVGVLALAVLRHLYGQ